MVNQKQLNSHLNFLDSIRALAAVLVVLHHGILYYSGNMNTLLGIEKILIKFLIVGGHYAVNMFIVLSGFSLMLAVIKNNYVLKDGMKIFFKRRFIRIVPPYYLAMLISILLIWLCIGDKTGSHWDSSIPVSSSGIFRHVFFIHDFFENSFNSINYSFWSVAVEFRIYLFFPFLIWIWRKTGPLSTLLVSFLIAFIGSILNIYIHHYYSTIDSLFTGISPYIVLFTLGMLAAEMSFSQNGKAIKMRLLYQGASSYYKMLYLFIFLMIFVLVKLLTKESLTLGNEIFISSRIIDILTGCLFAYILFIYSTSTEKNSHTYWMVKLLSWKPLVFIGTFSYSIYLIHAPLLQILFQYIITPLSLSMPISVYVLLLLGTPAVIVLSYLFFLLCERPFLMLRKKRNTLSTTDAISNPSIIAT
ncbi:hypothetical protein ADIARSV_4004 [Arcticibacter svalbardensis MN12-7]|uniref:Acyltransferase 3 domain-containing protein n=1 Tax=Arcticibacter svalbardensis MN12-7 TaxID=1150600 RepID=R9GMI5_9SPHI|nr:acyltransferase [Arcticibacter svalbardensis]EOR92916.1 hypothetical protein ADIARSV_4004 [Arcticibacter svalbardensis MN12-7]